MATANKSRIEVKGEVALQVVDRYKHDPVEFLRVIMRQELRPFQWEWWYLLEENPDCLCYACPRVGKTFLIELRNLYDEIVNPWDECLIFAPKFDQAVKTFEYQYQTVENNEILRALVRRNAAGKPELTKSGVQFINGSAAKCFGADSNFEGENATIFHVDELDDVMEDRLKRILGRGLAVNKNGLPTRHRFSGVIWGKLNIWRYKRDDRYFLLPPVDVYEAMAGGFLERKDVLDMRSEMSDDEWLRTMCLQFLESRNFIWSSWLHQAQMLGLSWGLSPVPYSPEFGLNRGKNEIISFGLDMGAQGGSEDSSEFALEVVAGVGQARRWLSGRTWPPDADPDEIIKGVADWWAFYRPDVAFGDARDANLIVQINEELRRRSLTFYDWRYLGDNTQDGWSAWAKFGLMAPVHNTGRKKHDMYVSLRNAINNTVRVGTGETVGNFFVFPYIDREKARRLESWGHLQKVIRELENLVSEMLPSGIYKIERYKKKINDPKMGFSGTTKLGDDTSDALAMANAGLDFKMAKFRRGFVGAEYVRGF